MKQDIRKWFIEKVAQNPEYLDKVYIPAIEREAHKAEIARDEAVCKDDLARIKYAQGRLDGVNMALSVIDGLKRSAEANPADPGLMDRMLPRFFSGRSKTPADLG